MPTRSTVLALVLLTCSGPLLACGTDEPADTAAPPADVVASAPATGSQEAEGDGDAAAEPIGPGAYQFDYKGAVGNVEIPLSPADPSVAELEDYRKTTGSDDVGYAKVVVDNTNGTSDINMYQVVAVTKDGEQFEFTGLDDAISTWQGRVAEDDGEGHSRGTDLINEHQFFLNPGAKGTAILINPEPVPDVARLFVYPAGGIDKVEAYPVR